MGWIYLILAGCTEVGWPIGLKMAQQSLLKWPGIMMSAGFIIISGYLLYLAQRSVPLGTAYAVWTGIGAAGTFLVGIWFYNDPTSLLRYLGIFLIISGVIVLKLAH